MSGAGSNPVYHRLVILAAEADTDIWLGDELGHFVQKEIGTLDTSLLPGEYTVEFGLGTVLYPIRLVDDSRFTQAELATGPTCTRRIPDL